MAEDPAGQADQNDIPQLRDHVRALEQELRTAQEGAARTADLERKLAFYEAGVPVTDKRSPYFMRGYDGELTVEAIKAAATEFFGPATPSTPPPAPDGSASVPDDDIATLAAMRTTTTTPTPGGGTGDAEYQQALAAARSQEEALVVMAKYGVRMAEVD